MKGWFCDVNGNCSVISFFGGRKTLCEFHQLIAACCHSCFFMFSVAFFFDVKLKKMKTGSLVLVLICIFQYAGAQVTGKLVAADGAPLVFANVSLVKGTDSSLVKAVRTNEAGIYLFNDIAAGKYILQYSSIGYMARQTTVFEVTIAQPLVNRGVLIMQENKKQLEEVVVRAQKQLYQQRPDGIVVNIENSLLSKGSTVLQVLERSPGVVINYRDNSIALNGKNGVMVMIDGKLVRMPMEQLVNFLSGMSADEIATIELLTTPPAKYDAEGSGGLINIVLKKHKKKGNSAAMSFTAGYSTGEKGTGSVNFSHNTGPVSLHGSYTGSHDRLLNDMFVESSQHMPFLGGDVSVIGWFTTHLVRNNHDASIAADIQLNANTVMGGGITYNNSRLSGNTITDAGYNVLPDSLLQFKGYNEGRSHWNNTISTVYLEKTIRPAEKINLSLDYLRFNNTASSSVQSSFINKHGMQAGTSEILFAPGQKGFAGTDIQVGVVKADYSKEVNKRLKIEVGIKGAFTRSTSISGIQSLLNNVWTSSDQTSNHISMKEGIGASYVSVTSQVDTSMQFTVGLRYEYAYTKMNNSQTGVPVTDRRLGSFFPTVFLSKKISSQAELQFSYTRRISRPSYNDLASYVGYSDPTAVYTGNPFLQPTITNNYKVGYANKRYSFSLMFSRDQHAIARYQLTESPGRDILYISPQNLNWQNNITLQASLPIKINNWWNMNYSIAGGPRWYRADYTKTPLQNTYTGYSINMAQLFTLPRNFSAEISGWYNNTVYNGTQQVAGFGVLNAGIKKELTNNAGSLQLSVSDILMDQRYDIHYGTLTQEAFSIKSHVVVNTESSKFPIIKLSYARSFGGKIKTEKKRETNTSDERSRVNN